MMSVGVCPICHKRKPLSCHHILKWIVYHDDGIDNQFFVCEKCHNQGKNCLEELIRERENELLRQHPWLYRRALSDYLNGVRPNHLTYTSKRRRRNGVLK
jgi:hypothetical protein